MKKLYKNWWMHNMAAHPLMQICDSLGLENLANKIHDGTLPSKENRLDPFKIRPQSTAVKSIQLIDREIFDDISKHESFWIINVRYYDPEYALVDVRYTTKSNHDDVLFSINLTNKKCLCLNKNLSGFFYLK